MKLQAEAESTAVTTTEAADDAQDSSYTRTYPSSYISHSSPSFIHMRALWDRFNAWIIKSAASDSLSLHSSPASSSAVFSSLASFGAGCGLSDEECDSFTLPDDVLASLACHDGQDQWASSTGIIGRWYWLGIEGMWREWRDQKEMMEMGLYDGKKYQQARKGE